MKYVTKKNDKFYIYSNTTSKKVEVSKHVAKIYQIYQEYNHGDLGKFDVLDSFSLSKCKNELGFTHYEIKAFVLFMKKHHKWAWYCIRGLGQGLGYVYRGITFAFARLRSEKTPYTNLRETSSITSVGGSIRRPCVCWQVQAVINSTSLNKLQQDYIETKGIHFWNMGVTDLHYGYYDHNYRYDRNINLLLDHVIAENNLIEKKDEVIYSIGKQ